ncbi:MAG: 23S rRNA (adenine(2503)-C(2))-methyltransferase RlmN [Planctomycetota bacterium]|nr:23S rRNA (adenine(2503)-C(2))-methyltransferase RlmN [Planctomycetota bacterium]
MRHLDSERMQSSEPDGFEAGRPGDGAAGSGREPPRSMLEWTKEEMEQWCVASGFPPFHGPQILRWIHERLVTSFGEMTDLPTALRERLEGEEIISTGDVIREERAADSTRKLLIRYVDGQSVECVLIPEASRITACISTQVGCAVRCVFCASGLEGVKRNLTAGEIVEQVLALKRKLGPKEKITNLVFMGMGEPLHNVSNLLRSIEILRAPWGANLGARRITVSTSGPPGRIPRLTEAGVPVHLAVSLHAPYDDLRRKLIPGKTSPVADLIAESKEFFRKTGRRVTFEVALIDGLNCERDHARSMGKRLKGFPCLVNLIPMNPVEGVALRPPSTSAVLAYRKELESHGVEVAIRMRKGDKIAAACGQLRMRTDVARQGGG